MNREDFPILEQHIHGRRLVYLDNAATSQKPKVVIDAINYAYTHFNANVHRGVHHLSQVATEHHEHARQTVADFINARSANEIVFTKGTTDSLNLLAFCLSETFEPGDEIIVSAMEHHSNIVPWQMACERRQLKLRVIPLCEDLTLDIEKLPSLINEKTKLISIAHASNVLGIENRIEQVIQIAHRHGILVAVDAAQSIAHSRIDVQKLDCDFLAFSGHKIYGPTGIGVLYGKEKLLDKLPPYQGGGEMIQHVSFQGTTFNSLPYKFEAGTPDFIGSYGLEKALEYVKGIGIDKIAQHETELTARVEQLLSEDIAGIKIYAAGQTKRGAVSVNVFKGDGSLIHPFDIGVLLDHQGVEVRTGHHCAQPLMEIMGVPGTIRISVGLYNDETDIDVLVEAMKKSVAMLA